MANLVGTPVWSDVVQLETSTLALGGAGGPMNAPQQALTNRTEWLKNRLNACCGSVSCTPCLKSVWIPADDFVPDGGGDVVAATLTITTAASTTVKTDVMSYSNSVSPSESYCTIRMPSDWNNGPYWIEFDWITDAAPASGTDVTWIAQQLSAESGVSISGEENVAPRTVISSTGLPYVINTVRMYNLYPKYNSDGALIVFSLMRSTTDPGDDMDEEAHVFGITLHYTPKDCDYNLLSEFYLTPDSCLGHSFSGDFYQEIVTNTDSMPLQTTAKVDVAADDWASITFTIELSGTEPAIDVTVSSATPAFTAVTESAAAGATTVTVTVLNDLGLALSSGDTFTISLSATPLAYWTLKSAVLSKHEEPTGCAVVYSQP